jgi:hypothetical protein
MSAVTLRSSGAHHERLLDPARDYATGTLIFQANRDGIFPATARAAALPDVFLRI